MVQKIKKCKKGKLKIVNNANQPKLTILEGLRQNGLHHRIRRICLRMMAHIEIDSRHAFEYDNLLTLESLTAVLFGCFEGLGLCQNDFLKRKASDCIYQSRKRYQETYLLIFSKVRNSSRRGAFGQNIS